MPEPSGRETPQSQRHQPQHPLAVGERGVLQDQPGEDAQETAGDGRQGAQEPFRIVIAIMLAQRQELLIHVIGQIGPFGPVAGPMPRHGNPRHHRPIAQQDARAGPDERLGLEVAEHQAREEVTQGDPLQHSEQADLFERRRKSAVIQDADEVQQGRPFEDPDRGRPAVGLLEGFAQREHQRHPGDEDEEWEDQVLEMEPSPRLVVQLLGDQSQQTAAGELLESPDQLLGADDPEHVEAAQGIERHQAGLGGLDERLGRGRGSH